MEIGQGPNWGRSAKTKKKYIYIVFTSFCLQPSEQNDIFSFVYKKKDFSH
jgi:hypothetical protein